MQLLIPCVLVSMAFYLGCAVGPRARLRGSQLMLLALVVSDVLALVRLMLLVGS